MPKLITHQGVLYRLIYAGPKTPATQRALIGDYDGILVHRGAQYGFYVPVEPQAISDDQIVERFLKKSGGAAALTRAASKEIQ